MPKIAPRILNEKVLEELTFQPGKNVTASWYADASLRGFNVNVRPDGAKTFGVRFTTKRGKRRFMTLGRWGVVTLKAARDRARQILAEASLGGDPAAEQKRLREIPTWEKWAATYLGQITGRRKSTRSDARYLEVCTAAWKGRPLDTITRADVEAVYGDVHKRGTADDAAGGPYPTSANRWIQAVRPCFEEALRAGHITANPARGLKRYLEAPPRARVLTDDEMRRLLKAALEYDDVHVRAAVRLLVETGARLSEVLRAKWEDFDLEAGTWRIPSPKAGHPQTLPLASQTVAMLKRTPVASDYVVFGSDPEKPRSDLKKPWTRICTAAGLDDVHIHDVRRSFGLAIARSAGLHVASKLLRHGDVRVTERAYAPLGLEDLRGALQKRTEALPFNKRRNAKKRR